MNRLLPLLLVVAACTSGSASPVPDFQLSDVNPNSPTSGQMVSPRDYMGFTSAWYFGAAT